MANHCYDVMCLDCGRYWCERGCNSHGQYPAEILKKINEEHLSGVRTRGLQKDLRCECGSKHVVWD